MRTMLVKLFVFLFIGAFSFVNSVTHTDFNDLGSNNTNNYFNSNILQTSNVADHIIRPIDQEIVPIQNTSITPQLRQRRNLFLTGSSSSVCPPPGFDAKQDFDIDLYFGKWYVQKQIPVAYQTLSDFYCVTATYSKDTSFCLFCNYAPRIDILNEARQDSVTGPNQGGAVPFFRGIIRQPKREPAKITVGTFAPFLIRARYWVIATGSYNDIVQLGTATGYAANGNYEWAIITGGSPIREGMNGKCKPDPGILNFLGMWMFVRDPVPPDGVIDAIDNYANNVLGLDTTAWLPVAQVGCVYE